MVNYVAPTFKYPATFTAGTWVLLLGADNTDAAANGGTYASSGYVQLDSTTWAAAAGSAGATKWAPKGNLLNVVPAKDVLSIDVHRGRTREDQAVDVGVMTVVLDNLSGDYDIDNNSSPWQFPIYGGGTANSITRGTWAQLLYATSASTYVKAFTGFVESLECDQGIYPTATLTVVDPLARVAQSSTPAGFYGLPGETSATRIYNILASAGVLPPTVTATLVGGKASYAYDWTPGLSLGTLKRTHEAADLSGGPLESIENIAASEGGRVFATVDGLLRVVSHADLPTTASTADYTLTDAGSGGFEYTDIETLPMHRQVVNQATVVAGVSGKTRTANTAASQARYGALGGTFTTSLSDDDSTTPSSSLQKLATFLASRRATPSTAFSMVRMELRGLTAANIETIIGGEIADKVTITRKTRTTVAQTITAGCWIEGIDFSITPDSWTWTLYTSAIDNPSATY